MHLEQLEAFYWVAKLGSFSRTGVRLRTTQPAISSRISKLENELGVALFIRNEFPIKLSARGEALMPLAEKVISAAEKFLEQARVPVEATGPLRIGASETIACDWLPDFVTELHRSYPKLDVDLRIDVTENMKEALIERTLDLAFLMGPIADSKIKNLAVGAYSLVWAMRRDSGSGQSTRISLAEMLNYPILCFASNTKPYNEIRDAFLLHTGTHPRLFGSSSLSSCQRMAEHGVGIAVLPRALAVDALRQGRLVELEAEWLPSPLTFTASFAPDPLRPFLASIAHLASQFSRD